jgi:hypothetical protein
MKLDLPLRIRVKYGLVHVPSRHRTERWVRETREAIASGLPPEHAGLQSARHVFPYEAREVHAPDAIPVVDLIDREID